MTVFSHGLNTVVKPIAKHSLLAGNYASPMDIFEIRRRNLQAILDALEARGVTKNKDQAQQIGALGASYLSQLKAGKKIGEDTARKIEAATRRPSGWMDQPQWKDAHNPALQSHSHPVRLDPEIVRGVARAMQDVFEALQVKASVTDTVTLFTELYDRIGASGITTADIVWLTRRVEQGAGNAGRSNISNG